MTVFDRLMYRITMTYGLNDEMFEIFGTIESFTVEGCEEFYSEMESVARSTNLTQRNL